MTWRKKYEVGPKYLPVIQQISGNFFLLFKKELFEHENEEQNTFTMRVV